MNPQEFAQMWIKNDDVLEPFDISIVKTLFSDPLTKKFLSSGIPRDAAPFLSFGPHHDANLQSVSEQFNIEDAFDRYKIIGWNGYGDPIAVDEFDNSIVYLNHDDEFGYVFMSTTLEKLLQILLTVREFIEKVNTQPSQKYAELYELAISELNSIDPKAIKEGPWGEELRSFIE